MFNVACSLFGVHSEENPKYEVLQKTEAVEVRRYSSYLVAKTSVKGEFKEAQSQAFRILAGYIFGANQKKEKVSMTSPVFQGSGESGSEKISMTAPVMQSLRGDEWTMSFMMPSKYQLADLPSPEDKRIQFAEVPPKIFAVIQFSGLGRKSQIDEKILELEGWLKSQPKWKAQAAPVYAGYDPPWTLPPFRRNEVMIEVVSID